MKFDSELINFNKEEWIKYQNETLNMLNEVYKDDKSKVNQALILENAAFLAKSKLDKKYYKAKEDSEHKRVYFAPVLLNSVLTVDELVVEARSYYFDEFDKLDVNFKPQAKFEYDKDLDEKSLEFADTYVQQYQFEVKSDRTKVAENDLVEVSITDPNTKEDRVGKVLVNEQTKHLFSNLIDKEVGQNAVIKDPSGVDVEVKILAIYEYKAQPITDENVAQLNLKGAKTLADAKKIIVDAVHEESFDEALVKYGEEVLKEMVQKNSFVSVNQEIFSYEFQRMISFYKEIDPEKLKADLFAGLTNYLWSNILLIEFDFSISNEEIQQEGAKVMAMTQNQADITVDKIMLIILFRKIGLRFLKTYQNEEYNLVTKYISVK
ncbi:hypothetical protein GE118_01050 [Mycoplasma sp. NEAQ87857]|uniref:trigger factor-related chaperone n=1 Tax=Mycoplasma sp. NEAQ87857 TaxID=2683967 RepID=UPI00131726B6|nr:hypothetical protein [Mycoplasma sp. NEAQ87857]QGZ97380.1 hypothetical protein GE118_01050 [Mycoplasma sp. NEAQ87857]